MQLRPYQVNLKESAREAIIEGNLRIMCVAPTGSGKTVTFADIASGAIKKGNVVMVLVDRAELLQQAKNKLINYGINPSIITGGRRGRLNSEAYVATVQTLINRKFPEIDLLIIDEAHKQIFDKILDRPEYSNIQVLAFTATPVRTGKMNQLSKYYSTMIEVVTISALIEEGFLVPAITYGSPMDTSSMKIKGGEYDEAEMFNAFNKPKLYAGVVDQYRKFASGTKAIVFNVNVEHSKKTAEAFNAAGIPAYHLDGNTPTAQRQSLLEAFSKGLFRVLCNVDILTTGFDEWSIETVIVNRATVSLTLWLQMCGRGSRITPKQFEGVAGALQKSHFNLIDMGGNVWRLGFWEQDREFSLDHKTKDKVDAAPVKECPETKEDIHGAFGCGALMPASVMQCKICGYNFPIKKTELAVGEFLPLNYSKSLPDDLKDKKMTEMSLEELERVRIIKGYKLGWIVKLIALSEDLNLLQYAEMRKFKHPERWVQQMKSIYYNLNKEHEIIETNSH